MSLHRVCFTWCFQNWLFSRRNQRCQEVENLTFDMTCDFMCDIQIKFCSIFGKLMPGSIKYRFLVETRSNSLADSTGEGGEAVSPQRLAGAGNSPAGRGLKQRKGDFDSARLSDKTRKNKWKMRDRLPSPWKGLKGAKLIVQRCWLLNAYSRLLPSLRGNYSFPGCKKKLAWYASS